MRPAAGSTINETTDPLETGARVVAGIAVDRAGIAVPIGQNGLEGPSTETRLLPASSSSARALRSNDWS